MHVASVAWRPRADVRAQPVLEHTVHAASYVYAGVWACERRRRRQGQGFVGADCGAGGGAEGVWQGRGAARGRRRAHLADRLHRVAGLLLLHHRLRRRGRGCGPGRAAAGPAAISGPRPLLRARSSACRPPWRRAPCPPAAGVCTGGTATAAGPRSWRVHGAAAAAAAASRGRGQAAAAAGRARRPRRRRAAHGGRSGGRAAHARVARGPRAAAAAAAPPHGGHTPARRLRGAVLPAGPATARVAPFRGLPTAGPPRPRRSQRQAGTLVIARRARQEPPDWRAPAVRASRRARPSRRGRRGLPRALAQAGRHGTIADAAGVGGWRVGLGLGLGLGLGEGACREGRGACDGRVRAAERAAALWQGRGRAPRTGGGGGGGGRRRAARSARRGALCCCAATCA
jgi:hypothetical protein